MLPILYVGPRTIVLKLWVLGPPRPIFRETDRADVGMCIKGQTICYLQRLDQLIIFRPFLMLRVVLDLQIKEI